ncbi:MAG: DUF169 domain-containing protein [Crenarchaeota archaeon]|nr:DUF169 domain-containing protein [Thermoproteota archaeon]
MNLEEIEKLLVESLKLKLEPIGVKMLRDSSELGKIGAKPYPKNLALCQYLKAAALFGKPFGLTPENCDACVIGSWILGLRELPKDLRERWCELAGFTPEVFDKMISSTHALPAGSYGASVIAPLRFFSLKNIEPDAVILFVNSAQAYIMLSAYFDSTGSKPASDFNGHAACEIVAAVMKGRSPWLTIPCGGARALAESQDDELWLGFRLSDLEKAVARLKKTRFRYAPPILQMLLIPPQPEFVLTKLIARSA